MREISHSTPRIRGLIWNLIDYKYDRNGRKMVMNDRFPMIIRQVIFFEIGPKAEMLAEEN